MRSWSYPIERDLLVEGREQLIRDEGDQVGGLGNNLGNDVGNGGNHLSSPFKNELSVKAWYDHRSATEIANSN